MTHQFDLFVIGGGSGGVRAARFAATLGAKVAIAEERYWGGTCVNVGCVPKKLLSYAAHCHAEFADAAGFGWTIDGSPRFDWPTLIANKNREIERLNAVYRRVLGSAGVTLLDGRATLVDAHTVRVVLSDGQEQIHTVKHILIATGGWPVKPAIPGAEHAITSNEAFFLPELPKRAIVVGGGYIAVEFASIFNGLGAQTTLLHRGTAVLKEFDHELGPFLTSEMAKKGVQLVFSGSIARIIKSGAALQVALQSGAILEADCVLFATGRAPNAHGLGLEAAGVSLNAKGAIEVNPGFQTSVPHIYAIGDVIDRVALTPVATAEGMVVAHHLFGNKARQISYDNIATAVFSHPNVGSVGLSETAARAKAGADGVTIFRSTFTPMKHSLSGRSEKTLMKLVVERSTDRVLGVHMVGPDAGEIIQGFAVALNCGATKAQFDATIGIHPTAAEEFVTMRESAA